MVATDTETGFISPARQSNFAARICPAPIPNSMLLGERAVLASVYDPPVHSAAGHLQRLRRRGPHQMRLIQFENKA